MKTSYFTQEGRSLTIGDRIGRGGEGDVYALNDGTGRAFKRYTVQDLREREAKVSAMVRAGMAHASQLVAFPLAIACDGEGQFAGFLMNLVRNHKPLYELYSPGARKQNFPKADYRFLIRTASNIARAVASVHRANCIIGDINASGILISDAATAALIDADSFQIVEGASRFLCQVGTPDYTPPELQGVRLGDVERTKNHDAFGLAVVIFQLLFMGRHPFSGAFSKGEMPLDSAIKECRFVYSLQRSVGMTPPPGVPSLNVLPSGVKNAFESAFSEKCQMRPTAEDWIQVLDDFENSLKKCADNDLHFFSAAANHCPWCAMETSLGMMLFLPKWDISDAGIIDDAMRNFDLSAAWANITAITLPQFADLNPVITNLNLGPSSLVTVEKDNLRANKIKGIALLVLALVFWCFFPSTWFIWALIIVSSIRKLTSTESISAQLYQRYDRCQDKWGNAVSHWRARLGYDEIHQLKKNLTATKAQLEDIPNDLNRRLANYMCERRQGQLDRYLDRFSIAKAKISGVGPAKTSSLRSYGIETAADVTLAKVLSVPGFGQSNSKPLLEWRAGLESKFTFDDRITAIDKQERAKIETEVAHQANKLRKLLLVGATDLKNAASKIRALSNASDPQLASINYERSQIESDLVFLGLPSPKWAPVLPTVPPSAKPVGKINRQSVDAFFGMKTRLKGDRYEATGMVKSAAFDTHHHTASGLVSGQQSKQYHTRITLDAQNAQFTSSSCTCPVARNCKHSAALILHLIKRGQI